MSPDDVRKEFEAAEAFARALQFKYAQCAQHVGQVGAVLNSTKPFWMNLATQQFRTDVISMLESGCAVVGELNRSLQTMTNDFEAPVSIAQSTAISALSFGSNTVTASFLYDVPRGPVVFEPKAVPKSEFTQGSDLEARFTRLDPALGAVWRQIWECLYGTTSDPERSALYMMRQTWDHLFFYLAPDVDVRASEFFSEKGGEKPEQITREERIRFAIAKKVKKPGDQTRLLAGTKQMLELYQELNRAHVRREMDREEAVSSLHSLQDWLVQWADALEKRE